MLFTLAFAFSSRQHSYVSRGNHLMAVFEKAKCRYWLYIDKA